MILVEHDEFETFVEYCNAFYSKGDGIYPIASEQEIRRAINVYLEKLDGHEWMEWGYGDSIDRERVREILDPSYSIVLN